MPLDLSLRVPYDDDIGSGEIPEGDSVPVAQYSLKRVVNSAQKAGVAVKNDGTEYDLAFLPGMPSNGTRNLIPNANFTVTDANKKPYGRLVINASCTITAENNICTIKGTGQTDTISYSFLPLIMDRAQGQIYLRAYTHFVQKNKLGWNASTYTANGVTTTVTEDGLVTLNGTSTATGLFASDIYVPIALVQNKSYTFSMTHVSGTTSHPANISLENSNNSLIAFIIAGGAAVATFSGINDTAARIRITGTIGSGITFNNYAFRLQVENGTAATTWDRYRYLPTTIRWFVDSDDSDSANRGSLRTQINLPLTAFGDTDQYQWFEQVMTLQGTGAPNHILIKRMGFDIIYANAAQAGTGLLHIDGAGDKAEVCIDMGYESSHPYYGKTATQMRTIFPGYVKPFGWSAGEIDNAALLAWAAGADVRLKVWEDQQSSRDFSQTDWAKMPIIMRSGIPMNCLFFDGVDDQMTAPNALLNGLTNYSIVATAHNIAYTGVTTRRLVSMGASGAEGNGIGMYLRANGSKMEFRHGSDANLSVDSIREEYNQKWSARKSGTNGVLGLNDVVLMDDGAVLDEGAISATYPVRLSGHQTWEYWYGPVTELSVYNYSLTAQQLAEANLAKVQTPDTMPVALVPDGTIGAWGINQVSPGVVSKTNIGENLYRNAETFPDLKTYPWNGYAYAVDKNFYRANIIPGATIEILAGTQVAITPGRYYTMSFEYRTDSTDMIPSINFHNPGVMNYGRPVTITYLGNGVYRATACMLCNFGKLRVPDISLGEYTTGTYFDVRNFKLEEGQYNTIPVRYIRDWMQGYVSTGGTEVPDYNHWVEIQAFNTGGENVALNKTVMANNGNNAGSLSQITNGNTTASEYVQMNTASKVYVKIDLGQVFDVQSVKLWHYYTDGRKYHKTRTQVSVDGINWTDIFNSEIEGEYFETAAGKTITGFQGRTAWCPNQADIHSGIRIQRADGTQKDVVFNSGYVDFDAIASFCNSKEARVCRKYDGSGYHHHWVQDSWANMPVVFDKTMLSGITFNGAPIMSNMVYRANAAEYNLLSFVSAMSGCTIALDNEQKCLVATGNGTDQYLRVNFTVLSHYATAGNRYFVYAKMKIVSEQQPAHIKAWIHNATGGTYAVKDTPAHDGTWIEIYGIETAEETHTSSEGGAYAVALSIRVAYATAAQANGAKMYIQCSDGNCPVLAYLGSAGNWWYEQTAEKIKAQYVDGGLITYDSPDHHSYLVCKNTPTLAAMDSMTILTSFIPTESSTVANGYYLGKLCNSAGTGNGDDGKSGLSGWQFQRNGSNLNSTLRFDTPSLFAAGPVHDGVLSSPYAILISHDNPNNILTLYKDWVKATPNYSGLAGCSGDTFALPGSLSNSFDLCLGGYGTAYPGAFKLGSLILRNVPTTDAERAKYQKAIF